MSVALTHLPGGPGPAPGVVDTAADLMWMFGPDAVEERDNGGVTELIAGYADESSARQAARALGEADLGPVLVDAVAWGAGLDGWRQWATVEHADPFVLIPAWLPAPPVAATEVAIHLDPGHTFGSGSHPTTRLVLSTMAPMISPGIEVLDVGCGSGVLAVGAALLGAGRVVATDIDPDSAEVTAANAVRNGVDEVVVPVVTSVDGLEAEGETFDMVLANLLAPIIAEIAPSLVALTATGGTVVLSGLLEGQWSDTVAVMIEAATAAGRTIQASSVTTEEGWAAVCLTI